MIDVLVLKDGAPISKVEITKTYTHEDRTADYVAKFAVERGSAVGTHRRILLRFPRKHLNALALARLALESLNEKELELERDFDPDEAKATLPANLARGLRETMREIQAWFR